MNAEIVDHGRNGLLAYTPEEWADALEDLLTHPERSRDIAAAGRRTVEERYSVEVCLPRLHEMLLKLIADKSPP